MEGESVSSEVFISETREWNIAGKRVLVSISQEPDESIKFLGVAGQGSAGDIMCTARLVTDTDEGSNVASLQFPTSNGIVDPDAFKQEMRSWLTGKGYVAVN